MDALQKFAQSLPEAAKDIRMNLGSVLQQSSLQPVQRFGVALAVAHAARDRELAAAIVATAGDQLPAAVQQDAQAAAALMAMNNVYYRFRHMLAKPIAALDRASAQARAPRGRHRGPRWEHCWGPPRTRILARREDSRDYGPEYEQLPPRLRMQRLAAPAGNKVDFELFALAVSAVNGCATCVQAHERVVVEGVLTPAHVKDAVRIAAVVHAATVAAAMAVPVRAESA